MLRYPEYTRNRIRQLTERLQAKIYREIRPVDLLEVSPATGRISRDEALKLNYRPVKPGEQFGPLWTTFWFKAKATVPPSWHGGRVDLLWVSHSEATLWLGGQSAQGLNYEPSSHDRSGRPDALLRTEARGGETIEFEIEMACNTVFGFLPGIKFPYQSLSPFVLDQCDIAWLDPAAESLYYDLNVLQLLEAEAAREENDLDAAWSGELMQELNRVANQLDADDPATWPGAQEILRALYEKHNATRVHELSVIGHAHIDTAWLWPLAETYRKCVRSFSSQVSYMERYPEFRFACSQAQQYDWIKQRNPSLYQRISERIKTGQWVPVGGTWIEPDCNIPSGESLARQFLYGQRFFQREFGLTCREFWNPDVFGYNGQLPQILRQSGVTRFLTQKLSWNHFNKPAHHTFTWQGIDGSEVITHFPPADNYNALVPYRIKDSEVTWLRQNARDYKDHVRSKHSLMLYGFGDGGGGPTPRMLEILRRVKDLQGVPRTTQRTSDEFFTLLEDDAGELPTLVGELYFEYHRGTYTSQAAVKKGNRRGETLLHDVEFLATLATKRHGSSYPRQELDRLWQLLLLNQFHDILPGSSINEVYVDAARDHAEIQQAGERLAAAALSALGSGDAVLPFNTIGFARSEVTARPDGTLVYIDAPAYAVGSIVEQAPDGVTLTRDGDKITLANAHLRAVLSTDGTLVSLLETDSGRETMSEPGNRFEIYEDLPTSYDAWDIDPFALETRQDCPAAASCRVTLETPLRAEVSFERRIGIASTLRQTVRLEAGARRLEFHAEVDWHEAHKLLKVAFPVNVHAMNATYEMQFGYVERPTHYTNSFDLAKYEVPAHKWADLSEHGFGVALLNDCKYGYSTFGNTMRLSLLRSPKSPDPEADMGLHTFAYAIMPHAGGWRGAGVVAEGYRFNAPVRWMSGGPQETGSYATCDDPNLVLDTVKLAEDSEAVVVRLYECHGARGTARVRVDWPVQTAIRCNFLEEEGDPLSVGDRTVTIPYLPFQIITVKVS